MKRDVESGAQRARSPLLGMGRISRRGRFVLAGLALGGVLLYLASPRTLYTPRGEESPDGLVDLDAFEVDSYGDHFYPNYPQPSLAPMHPSPSELVDPRTLFPEVGADFLQPPKREPFPDDRLREIVSDPPVENVRTQKNMPPNAYSQTWEGPEAWDARGPGVEKIQWEGFSGDYETPEEKEVRVARKEAVKRGFIYAWQKYKDVAWGHDEVRPKTEKVSDPFNNWGASIIDTLDTLLLLGLEEEYDLCRPHVNQLNLHWVKGRDWSQGYFAPKSDKEGEAPWTIPRDRTATIPVFETGIRYLGGLLGAYDIAGDDLMVERAVDVATVLKRAFLTLSGLPQGARFDPGFEDDLLNIFQVSAAEVGSMSLELIRLSRVTGDRQWFDLAQRVTDFIEERVIPRSDFKPLLPNHFSPEGKFSVGGQFSFGGMADSYYEYLIKAYQLLEGGPLAEPYKRLYEGSIDAARKLIFVNVTSVPGRDLFTIGKYEFSAVAAEAEHLTCFAGAMLGLGAKLLHRPEDMVDAERFTQTCYWLSAATKTGVQPESVRFWDNGDPNRFQNITINGGRKVHPPADTFSTTIVDYHYTFKDAAGDLRFIDDQSLVADDSGRNGQPLKYFSTVKGSPPGTTRVSPNYINRPETIESVFYMYRLTGDKKWQEKGWRMFTSWMAAAKVPGGISSLRDVNAEPEKIVHSDNMESFLFAETFKYHYLLHAEPDLMSLDDFVLNTEAHPLIANGKKAGHLHLWSEKPQNLGQRGEGTDAQKWVRLGVLEMLHKAYSRPQKPPLGGGGSGPPRWNKGGGGGMGGGGGDPHHRPQPGE